jgi:hypothetical protein
MLSHQGAQSVAPPRLREPLQNLLAAFKVRLAGQFRTLVLTGTRLRTKKPIRDPTPQADSYLRTPKAPLIFRTSKRRLARRRDRMSPRRKISPIKSG